MAAEVDIKLAPRIELLLEENVEHFNRLVAEGRPPDLRGANLANLDLRKAQLKGLDMSGCYLRNANLKGLDLSGCNLRGASLSGAQISGTLFPDNISAEEVHLSLEHGTRLRVDDGAKHLKLLAQLVSEVYKMMHQKAGA